jgi:hypothetical protein
MVQRFVYHDPDTIQHEKGGIPISGEVDLIVAGGGVAGLSAAIAAARNCVKVRLVESYGFLGGTATASGMTVMVNSGRAVGVARELLDRLGEAGGATKWVGPPSGSTVFDGEVFKQVALQMTLDAGVKPLFYSTVVGAVMEANTVKGVVLHNKAGLNALLSKVTIDTTGDGDVAASAGAPFVKGREADGKMRPMALNFRVGGIQVRTLMKYAEDHPDQMHARYYPSDGTTQPVGDESIVTRLSGFYELVERAKTQGHLYPDCHYFRLESLWVERGMALVNTGRIYNVDGTNPEDLTQAEVLGRHQMARLLQFMRMYIPGCEQAFIIDSAPRLGIRETRRIIGDYTLRDEDVLAERVFADTIMRMSLALPRAPIPEDVIVDVHSPDPGEGSQVDAVERNPNLVPRTQYTVNIPYRCLLPRGVERMLVGGRCIAVSHTIDRSTRNMVHCMRTSQVAGTAAALAIHRNIAPRKVEVHVLRHLLEEQDVPVSG